MTALYIPDWVPIDDSSFKIALGSNSQNLTPIFGGVIQKINRGGDVWSIDVSTRQMDIEYANALMAILNQSNSKKLRFKLPNKKNLPDATATAGSGKSLTLSGLSNGTVLKAGSYLTIEYEISGEIRAYLHQITDAATVSGGSVTVSINPTLRRTSNLVGSNVVLGEPYIEGFGSSTTTTLSSSNYRLATYKTSFGIGEVE